MSGLFIFFHQSQTVSLAYIGNLFVPVQTNSLIKIYHGLLVLLQLKIKLPSINISLIIFGILLNATIQLN